MMWKINIIYENNIVMFFSDNIFFKLFLHSPKILRYFIFSFVLFRSHEIVFCAHELMKYYFVAANCYFVGTKYYFVGTKYSWERNKTNEKIKSHGPTYSSLCVQKNYKNEYLRLFTTSH